MFVKMDQCVGLTLDKIKRQEQNKEAKLKAQREFEATKASLERSIREMVAKAKKLRQDKMEILKRTDELKSDLTIQSIRRDVLSAQLKASKGELEELKAKAEQSKSEVRELRSTFCKYVQDVSDNCDIWALLMKPSPSEHLPRAIKKPSESNEQDLKNKLKTAIERRQKAVTERERLMAEPDTGEEFVRKLIRTNRFYSSKIEPNENEPIKFSTSLAAQRTVRPVIRKNRMKDVPWYQPFSVVGSVAVFLIYFCILREENDVDLEFNKTLYDRMKGLEKQQLLQSYRYNKEQGLSVADIEKRLKELEAEEAELV